MSAKTEMTIIVCILMIQTTFLVAAIPWAYFTKVKIDSIEDTLKVFRDVPPAGELLDREVSDG